MKTSLVSEQTIGKLLRKKKGFVGLIVGLVIFLLGWIALVFLLQNRNTMVLWIVLGSFIASVLGVGILFVSVSFLRPTQAGLKFQRKSQSHRLTACKGLIVENRGALCTYEGIQCHIIKVKAEDERVLALGIPVNEKTELKEGQRVSLSYLDNIIVSYEVDNE